MVTGLIPVVGVSHDRTERSVLAGVQYFRFGPKAVWAFPVMRYERSPTSRAFAFATNPFFRLTARTGIAPDILVRKTFGRPWKWTAGAALRIFPGKEKKNGIEAGVFRNSQGFWMLRTRCSFNFAF